MIRVFNEEVSWQQDGLIKLVNFLEKAFLKRNKVNLSTSSAESLT